MSLTPNWIQQFAKKAFSWAKNTADRKSHWNHPGWTLWTWCFWACHWSSGQGVEGTMPVNIAMPWRCNFPINHGDDIFQPVMLGKTPEGIYLIDWGFYCDSRWLNWWTVGISTNLFSRSSWILLNPHGKTWNTWDLKNGFLNTQMTWRWRN